MTHWHQWRDDCGAEACHCGAYRPRSRARREWTLFAAGLIGVALVGLLRGLS